MTREEEIKTAAEEYANGSPNATLRHKAFIDGAKYADKHPAKKQAVTDAWVARNKHVAADSNTDLVLGKERPTLYNDTWCSMEEYYPLPQDALPSVTFENSPKKVKVTIELEEDQ